MARRQIITNRGMELLAASSSFTGQHFWLGYYAFAYVPNFWKDDDGDNLIDIPNCPDQMVNPTGSNPNQGPNLIIASDTDKLNSNMTKLTERGDMIWNVFQGDLVGTGFFDGISDGSVAGDLFGLTLYSANVKKHYRYMLDENGNNNLVSWVVDPLNPELMRGAYRYRGTDGFVSSAIPIPAPLYYFGDASKDNTIELPPFSITQYISDFLLSPETTGAAYYPQISVEVSPGSTFEFIPKVSADFRGYLDSVGNSNNSPLTPGTYFDSNEIPAANPVINNVNGWYDANSTHLGFTKPYLDEFHNLLTVSNYNRYHAPAGSLGNILNSDLKNRNMAKVSKLFPIFDYTVINSQRGYSSDGNSREVATGISLTINLDLAPLAKTQGYSNVDLNTGVGVYDEENDLTLQNRYTNPNNNTFPVEDRDLYNSTRTSFKFNRLGIYAVPLRKAPNSEDVLTEGKDIRYELEIDPDSEPVLFGVVDWDNVQYLSDSGDGSHQFRAQLNINLESPDGVDEVPLVRDSAIFYNLYTDSSIQWYRNQLLANASTQHAIIELQQELAGLKQKIKASTVSACCPTNTSNSDSGVILRNLLDSAVASNGGLRQFGSLKEGTLLDSAQYYLGVDSVSFGLNTASASDRSFTTGNNNLIKKNGGGAADSSIVGGSGNILDFSSASSSIIGGFGNLIRNSQSSIISASNGSQIYADSSSNASNRSAIIASSNSVITSEPYNYIGSTITSNVILGSKNSTIRYQIANEMNSIISSDSVTLDRSRLSAIIASRGITGSSQAVCSAIIAVEDAEFTTGYNPTNSVMLAGKGLMAVGNDCLTIGRYNDGSDPLLSTSLPENNAVFVIGGGENDLSRRNSFIFLTYPNSNPTLTGKATIYINQIPTEADLANLPSGCIYRDTSDGNTIKYKP